MEQLLQQRGVLVSCYAVCGLDTRRLLLLLQEEAVLVSCYAVCGGGDMPHLAHRKKAEKGQKSRKGDPRGDPFFFCLFSVCQMSPRKVEKSGGSLSRLISCSSKRGARSRSTEARRRRASRTSATNVQTLPLCKIGNYLSISEVLEVFVCDLKPAHLNLGELSKETYYRSKATHNSVEPAHLNLGELCSVPWMPPRAPYGLLWRRQPTRISTWASSARCCAS